MKCIIGIKHVTLSVILLLPLILARDPLYYPNVAKQGRRRSFRHATDHVPPLTLTKLAASSKPWRPPPSAPYTPPRRDYSSHFLDFEQARSDKRARYWHADLKTRRPGRLSLTSRIVWANVIMYALQMWRPSVTAWGVKRSDLILQGKELYRLFSPVWLHANPGHLFTNMFSLNRVGPDVEGLFGKGRFLTTYVASGIAGNLVSAYMSPNPGLGASGAVFGMIGAYVTFLSRHDWLLGRAGEDMSSRLIQTIVLNVGLGFISPMIDNYAHIGGAIGGAAMAYLIGPRLYLTDIPQGGRLVVDRPIVRLPRNIESIPERLVEKGQRIIRRMQVVRYKADLKDQPWRRSPNQFRRREAPNRSIKPGPVD